MSKLADLPVSRDQLISQAKAIFIKNLQQGYSQWKQTSYTFIAPANTEYIYQWQWDTAFHAITLAHFDVDWAKREIDTYLKGQWEDGFLPHVIFWQEKRFLPHWVYMESNPWTMRIHTTAITQPAMTAIAVEEIYLKDHQKDFLARTVPALARYHQWLVANRDPDHDGLLAIISPNESGMDELPVFQVALGYTAHNPVHLHYYYRSADLKNLWYGFNNQKILAEDYFNVEEVLFNCVFVDATRTLARLFLELGQTDQARAMTAIADKTEKAIIDKLWSESDGIFYSVYSRQETMVKVKTAASLMPLLLENLRPDQCRRLIDEHLLNPREFWTEYPVPSVAKDEPYYQPADTKWHQGKLLFRGPTWVNLNWLIIRGLRRQNRHDLADELASKTVAMVNRQGFREYYNPETGEGYRRKDFGWSSLVIDLL
jgi:glycogen debranching enzyme